MATEKYDDKNGKYGGYSKRPLWQWVLIYLVVGGIIYLAIYYLFFSGRSSSY